MDNESMLRHYKTVSKLIDKYRKGRTIVILGDSKLYKDFLEAEYGINDPMIITISKKKADDRITHIESIKHKNDKYYIVVPKIKKALDLQLRLFSYGYDDFEDCFFINHDRITIPPEAEEYTDFYGNHIVAHGCEVVLDDLVCNADIIADKSCRFEDGCKIIAKTFGGSKIRIEKGCVFENGVTLSVFGDAEISVGKNTTFVHDTEITVLGGMTLKIGRDCLFSCEIKIYCGDGHAIFDLESKKRINTQNKHNPKNIITIGDHVWAGMRSIILNRTVIGNSAIIGAGSVVKGIYPNNCVIAGNPARVIKNNITWSAESLSNNIDNIPPEYLTFTQE